MSKFIEVTIAYKDKKGVKQSYKALLNLALIHSITKRDDGRADFFEQRKRGKRLLVWGLTSEETYDEVMDKIRLVNAGAI